MCIAVLPIFKSKQKLKTSLGTVYHECVCVYMQVRKVLAKDDVKAFAGRIDA